MLTRTKAPAFSQNFSFKLPQPKIFSLANNAQLIWLSEIQQEVFKIEFIFNASRWNEETKGLAHFLALMLDKGTVNKSSSQISNALDFYGAQLEITPGHDYTSVSLYGLNKSLRKVFP